MLVNRTNKKKHVQVSNFNREQISDNSCVRQAKLHDQYQY